MDIQMYESSDVTGKRSRGKSNKYADYIAAVKPHIEWLTEQVEASKDGAIRVKLADFAKACGKVMKKVDNGKVVTTSPGMDPTSLGWGFKYTLFQYGFFLTTGKVENGQPVMIIRKKTEYDVLPKSLRPDVETDTSVDGDEVGEAVTGDEDKDKVPEEQ